MSLIISSLGPGLECDLTQVRMPCTSNDKDTASKCQWYSGAYISVIGVIVHHVKKKTRPYWSNYGRLTWENIKYNRLT